ncbi:MAG: hypothetical protein HY686_07605 [Chloroflexi bacterium]|nr:hypothetical protein [Chloroflexota bacterium]
MPTAPPGASPGPAVQAPTPSGPVAAPTVALPARPAETPGPTPTPRVVRVVAAKGYEGHPNPQAKYGGVLRTFIERGPGSCDLAFRPARGRVSNNGCGSMFNTLLRLWPNDELRPDLAERWEMSPDGLEWTLFLQKNVRWHDGKPFTADDVVYNFRRYTQEPEGTVLSNTAWQLLGVTDVRAVDEHTVKVRLKTPQADFLEEMGSPFFIMGAPQKLEALKAQGKPPLFINYTDSVGTGGFKPVRFIEESTYEMKRSDDYWVKGLPYMDGLQILVLPDAATRLAAMFTQRADMYQATELTTADARGLKGHPKGKEMTFINYNTGLEQVLAMNLKSPLMQDVRVREAILRATNVNEAKRVLGLGEGLTGGVMPPQGAWGLPKEELLRYPGQGPDPAADLKRAKELLVEAGFEKGFAVRPLLSRVTDKDVGTAVWVATRLNQIGIQAEGRGVDAAVDTLEIQDRRNYDVLGRYIGSSGSVREKMSYFLCEYTRTGNETQYCNREYDRLYALQSQTLDAEKRKQIIWDMQRMLMKEHAFQVLVWVGRNAAWWNYVKGYDPSGMGQSNHYASRYDLVWIDK